MLKNLKTSLAKRLSRRIDKVASQRSLLNQQKTLKTWTAKRLKEMVCQFWLPVTSVLKI